MTAAYFFLSFLLSLVALLLASHTDLKSRLVPNKLTYGLMTAGILLALAFSVIENDLNYLAGTIAGGSIALAVAWILHALGVWAGGDVKLLIGIGLASPLNPALLFRFNAWPEPLLAPIEFPVFALTLVFASVLAMMPYGVLLAIHGIFRKKNVQNEAKKEIRHSVEQAALLALFASGVGAIAYGLQLPLPGAWILLSALAWGFLPKPRRAIASAALFLVGLIGFGIGIFSTTILSFGILLFVSLTLVLLGLLPKVLRTTKKTVDLAEGDIPAQSFVESSNAIHNFEPPSIFELARRILKNGTKALEDVYPKGRLICDSRLARGLEAHELAEIQALHAQGRFPDEIEIKASSAFVPAMLIAFLFLALAGDLFWNLLL